MIVKIQLTENEHVAIIKTGIPFQSLKLISAEERIGQALQGEAPFLELTLLGPSAKFTFHANRLPSSNQFNCFDLLTIAKETIENPLVSFNEILISCNRSFYQDQFEIQVKIAYD
jgi:hypothetical protein